MPRTALPNFQLANRIYANCRVAFYTVAAGVATATLATLYAEATGTDELENPVRLDSDGKFADIPYIDAAVIGQVTGLSIATHSTAVINPAPTFRVSQSTGKLQYSYDAGVSWNDSGQYVFHHRDAWVTATDYNLTDTVTQGGTVYVCIVAHTSGVFATDLAAGKWLALVILTATGVTNTPAGNIAAATVQAALNELDTEKAAKTDVQNHNLTFAVASGTSDALTGAFTPAITGLTNGMVVELEAILANASVTPTFSPDGLTARTIVKPDGSPLLVGDIVGANHHIFLCYDASLTKWLLLNPLWDGPTPGAAATVLKSNGTTAQPSFGTASGASDYSYSSAAATLAAGTTGHIGKAGLSTTEGFVSQSIGFACTMSKLRAQAQVVPGVGETFVITVRKNGADTALTGTISGGASSGVTDLTHSVSFAAGDVWDVKVVSSAGAGVGVHWGSLQVVPA